MLHPKDRPEAVARFATAVGNISSNLLNEEGVPHAMLAAALRIEAGKIEVAGPREDMDPVKREMTDLVRKTHEFINTLQVAGVGEAMASTCMINALIERTSRRHGAKTASAWLRQLAVKVDEFGPAIEITAQSH